MKVMSLTPPESDNIYGDNNTSLLCYWLITTVKNFVILIFEGETDKTRLIFSATSVQNKKVS